MGPLSRFHLGGHHAIYPHSDACTSEAGYRGGVGGTNSAFSLLPWLLLQTLFALVVLPWLDGIVSFGETVLLLVVINYVHEQFHQSGSFWARFSSFRAAQRIHFAHHDDDCNYMVFDHTWDRLFKTYALPSPITATQSPERRAERNASGS
jgi:sterol desaturase/sphingolipid hydroxylase (fatty acid hydroxylase superfamily)